MADNYIPIQRQDRQSDIFVGDGGQVYGPFDFMIFDIGDVEVWTMADGETHFSLQPSVLVLKQSELSLDFFTITFPSSQPATTRIVVRSARQDERTTGVRRGTGLSPDALEREFSKIATMFQEFRRDIDRAWKSDFGEPALGLDANIQDGDTLMKLGDRLVKGANALDIANAQAYAETAKTWRDQAEDLVEDATLGIVPDGSIEEIKLAGGLRDRVTIDGGTLSAIHSSRAVGEPVFMGNGLVDGFGGDGGINAGASSGYVLDAANGRVMNGGHPLQQVDAVPAMALSLSDAGWSANTIRQRFAGAKVLQGGTKFRIRFKFGASGASFSSVYAGHAAAAGAFDGTQIPVTIGGSAVISGAANEEKWSDWMTYPVTAGVAFQVSGQCTSGGTVGRLNGVSSDYTFYFKAGTDAAGTSGAGYTATASTLLWVEEIEVEQPAVVENIVLVTAPYEFTEYTPAQLKVSGIIEALDALTLNTDVTIEVSRNGGANWTAATMTQLKALGAETYFETNVVSMAGQPAGDDIALRYKTLNSKRCYLHGLRSEEVSA